MSSEPIMRSGRTRRSRDRQWVGIELRFARSKPRRGSTGVECLAAIGMKRLRQSVIFLGDFLQISKIWHASMLADGLHGRGRRSIKFNPSRKLSDGIGVFSFRGRNTRH